MRVSSAVAIFFLFWSLSLFLVLPFRLREDDEEEDRVPGQAESAPPRFSMRRTARWTTLVAVALFGLFYLNYVEGWIGAEAFDFYSSHYRGPRF